MMAIFQGLARGAEFGFRARGLRLALWLTVSLATSMMAQTEKSNADRWLEALPAGPEFVAPTSRAAWEKERLEIRARLGELLGKLPPRPARPEVKTLSREDRGDFVLEKFTFDNGAGATVPGYVFLPKQAVGKRPAILYCHWHGGQYDIGKEEMFKTNATPVATGPELARKGYVVLGIDAYCFGERNGMGPGGPLEKGSAGEMTASKFNLWAGRSLWGMIIRDDLMALDYLSARPEVDATRIGVTGISMGATRTWWIMALDERPKCGVAVACLTRYRDLVRIQGLKYHGIYYFVPGMLGYLDTEAVVALAAPRPMLFMTGDKDYGSPVDGIRIIERRVKPVYGLYEREADFGNVIYPDLGHVYLPEMWQKTVGWLERNLQP